MRDFEDSTLWRVSAFERVRQETGHSGFARLGGATVLPTTLLSDLRRLERDPDNDDVLETLAACLRHRESALLYLKVEQLVWPVTVFPTSGLYHAPRAVGEIPVQALRTLEGLGTEPPGVKPPGHWMHERIGADAHYRPLVQLLWAIALNGPRCTLLGEIAGRAAYRLVPNKLGPEPLPAAGALSPAVQRLQREAVPLRTIASWPGMGVERASRLLNALYLCGGLLVTRTHPAARDEPGWMKAWFGGGKPRR